MTRKPLCLLATVALGLLGPAAGAQATPDHFGPTIHHGNHGASQARLDRVRAATSSFRMLVVAKAAGYGLLKDKDGIACIDNPGVGAMGYHYVNRAHMADGVLDVRRPELLVYVRTRHGLRLGAVEYFKADADQKISTNTDRPSLFGRRFDGPMLGHEPGMPIHYDLHVWLYQRNPAGLFATWNPSVRCPGSHR